MVSLQKNRTIEVSLPYVELSFGISGQTLPADHGYGLYSAIAHLCPELHQQDWLSVETVCGKPDRQGKINLTRQSRLKIRLPDGRSKVSLVLPLAGKRLTIGKHEIQLHIPQICTLQPVSKLRSRIVTIKGFQDPEPFLEAAKRQLDAFEIRGKVSIPSNSEGKPDRKTLKIQQYTVVGFGLEVTDLTDEDSIKLQILGCGGKRRMGAGVFVSFPNNRSFTHE